MTNCLCIYLAGPLASFGEAPGNTERGTADRPTRSALLGLAGAALGIRRDDVEGQQALSDSFAVATRTLSPGQLLTDFHTSQGVSNSSRQIHATRAAALRDGSVNTSITRREYRADGSWQVAYLPKSNPSLTLEALKAAFKKPYFTLWLGRKSCPLGHPLDPQVVVGEDLPAMFSEALSKHELTAVQDQGMIACEDASLAGSLDKTLRRNRRIDQPVSRRRWTFAAREEFEFMSGGPASARAGEGRS